MRWVYGEAERDGSARGLRAGRPFRQLYIAGRGADAKRTQPIIALAASRRRGRAVNGHRFGDVPGSLKQ